MSLSANKLEHGPSAVAVTQARTHILDGSANSTASSLLYAAMVGIIAVASFLRPYHNGDMVPYVANVIAIESKSSSDFQEICRKTDALIKDSVPASHYQTIGRTCDEFSSRSLAEALPWYSVKPLYILAVEALHIFRVPLVRATVLVSILSYIGLAWLLWTWIGWPAFILMIAPPIIANVRVEVPDELNILLTMVAFFLICVRRKYVWGSAVLLICIWCRPDMLIFSGLSLFALWLTKKIDLVEFGAFSAVALASYVAITHFSGNFGWAVLFKNSFTVAGVPLPGEEVVNITPRFYIQTLLDHLHSLEFQNVTPQEQVQSSLLLLVLLAALAIHLHRDRLYQVLTVVTLLAIAAHFLSMPSLYPRWLAPMYLFLMVSFICSLQGLKLERSDQPRSRTVGTLVSSQTEGEASPSSI